MAMNYAGLVTAVGGIAIGAFSTASGNKRAWKALNEKAKLAQDAQDFNNELAITQNAEDYYLKLQDSQQAKRKVEMYTNIAGYGVLGLIAIGVVVLVKKVT